MKIVVAGQFFISLKGGIQCILNLVDTDLPVPDLLFLDWNMPKKNGKDCLIAIRKLPKYAALPIIILSTSTAPRDREEASQSGASFFLSKPSTISELQKLLENIFH